MCGYTYEEIRRMTPYNQLSLYWRLTPSESGKSVGFSSMAEYAAWRAKH